MRQPASSDNPRLRGLWLAPAQSRIAGEADPIDGPAEFVVHVAIMEQRQAVRAGTGQADAEGDRASRGHFLFHPAEYLALIGQNIVVLKKIRVVRRVDFKLESSLVVPETGGGYYQRWTGFIGAAETLGFADFRR